MYSEKLIWDGIDRLTLVPCTEYPNPESMASDTPAGCLPDACLDDLGASSSRTLSNPGNRFRQLLDGSESPVPDTRPRIPGSVYIVRKLGPSEELTAEDPGGGIE